MNHRFANFMLVTAAALACVLVPAGVQAQVNVLPPELEGVGVTEHLTGTVPTEAVFREHTGRMVRLGQFVDGRRPVVLMLVYNRCPMLCSMVLNGLVRGLRETPWTVGQQFDVVTISIDPTDAPNDLARRRQNVLQAYGRAPAESGWHFLTGNEGNIRRVADAVGFRYRYDARQNQYAHPAVVFVLTPAGRIARYLYGIEFRENDLRLGLLEASEGRSITTVERVLLFCYHYDPQGKKYALVATRVMQLGGAVTAIALGVFLTVMWARERQRRRGAPGLSRISAKTSVGFDPTGNSKASLVPSQDAKG